MVMIPSCLYNAIPIMLTQYLYNVDGLVQEMKLR